MESPTKAPTTDSSSTGEPAQSCIIPDCYVDASIPPESQIAALTPAGLGIYLSNLQVRHQSSMIKAHVMDVDSPLQAETLAVQLATQVLKALQQQQYKLSSGYYYRRVRSLVSSRFIQPVNSIFLSQ